MRFELVPFAKKATTDPFWTSNNTCKNAICKLARTLYKLNYIYVCIKTKTNIFFN